VEVCAVASSNSVAFVLLRFRRRNSFEAAPIYSKSITLAMVVLTFVVLIAVFYIPLLKINKAFAEWGPRPKSSYDSAVADSEQRTQPLAYACPYPEFIT